MTMRFVRGLLCSAAVFSLGLPAVQAADTLGQSVGAALQQAQSALAAHNYAKALAAVNEADAVSEKSAYEDYVIAQMRAAVASQAGDVAQATSAYEKLIASPRTPRNLKNQMLMSEGTMAYNAKDYPKAALAIQRYLKEAGPNPQMETLLAQCYYLQKDYSRTLSVLNPVITRTVKAGQKPVESQLQMLAASATALKDSTTATHAYVLLATYYPKKEYWALLLHELVVNTKIPPSLQLDVYRIRLAVGDISTARDFMDMTEIAMQGHMPQLALDLMNQGYQQGVLGQGAEAPRQARLKAMVEKTVDAKKASLEAEEKEALAQTSGNALLNVGYNYVIMGQAPKGLALMQQAMTKGVTDSNIARLHLGLAQMQAGNKAEAVQTLKTVAGDNGAYDIAQLWLLRLGQGVVTH